MKKIPSVMMIHSRREFYLLPLPRQLGRKGWWGGGGEMLKEERLGERRLREKYIDRKIVLTMHEFTKRSC